MLNSELQSLRTRVKALSETVEALTAKNALLLAEKATGKWLSTAGAGEDVTSLIQAYLEEIEELKSRLLEAEALYQQLKKKQMQVWKKRLINLKNSPKFYLSINVYYFYFRSHSQIICIQISRRL